MTTTDHDSIEALDAIEGFWDAADAIQEWIDAHPGRLWNVSTVARRAKVDYLMTSRVLDYLDRHQYIVAEGNGAWRKFASRS
jgi:hypothetical protein